MQRAFTLVELAIVLVIIGLLVGGVLVGRDLIQQAQIRALMNEHKSYVLAAGAFRTKYGCLPGDCDHITAYMAGATNGNGDGLLGSGTTNDLNLRAEGYQFYYQLSQAGMIAGDYTGTGAINLPVFGVNAPIIAAVGRGAWGVGAGLLWANPMVNYLFMGDMTSPSGDCYGAGNGNKFYAGVITPREASSIDTKIDDGIPQSGSVAVGNICTNQGPLEYCLTGSNWPGAHSGITYGVYLIAQNGRSCGLNMRL